MAKWVKCPVCGKVVNSYGFYLHFSQKHPDRMNEYQKIRDNIEQYYVEPSEETKESETEQTQEVETKQETEEKREKREELRDIWKEPPNRNKILLDIVRNSPYLPNPEKAAKVLENWIEVKGELTPMDVFELLVKMRDVDKKEAELISEQYALAVQKAEREWAEYMAAKGPKYYIPPSIPSSIPQVSPEVPWNVSQGTTVHLQHSPPFNPPPSTGVPPTPVSPPVQHVPPYTGVSDIGKLPPEVEAELKALRERLAKFEEREKSELEQKRIRELREEIVREYEERMRNLQSQYNQHLEKLNEQLIELQNLLAEKEAEKEREKEETRMKKLEEMILQTQMNAKELQRTLEERLSKMEMKRILDEREQELQRWKSEAESIRRELESLKNSLTSRSTSETTELVKLLTDRLAAIESKISGGSEKPSSLIDLWESLSSEKEKYKRFAREFLGMTEAGEEAKDVTTLILGRLTRSLDKFVDMLGSKAETKRYISPGLPQFTPIQTAPSRDELRKLIEEKKRLEEEQRKLKLELAKRELLGETSEEQQPVEATETKTEKKTKSTKGKSKTKSAK